MKRQIYVILTFALCLFAVAAQAKKKPVIQFEQTTINLGTFSLDNPVQKCTFRFKNVGKTKVVINHVYTSCGCTDAKYPKDYISPGASGEISVTYSGEGKLPGAFKRMIQVFYVAADKQKKNDDPELVRLFITGDMTDVPVSKKTK